MSLWVEVAAVGERARAALGRAAAEAVARDVLRAEGVRHALVSITFVSRARIAELNRRHLLHRGATDVIAFGFTRATPRDPVIGDVYICPDVARANAESAGEGVRAELVRLVVHGTLHVLGYDHPAGPERTASTMWNRQERLVRRALTRGIRRGAPHQGVRARARAGAR